MARGKLQGKSPDAVPQVGRLTVRVINNVRKLQEVKLNFYEAFKQDGFPANLPYRQKVRPALRVRVAFRS